MKKPEIAKGKKMAEELKIALDDTYMNVIRFGSGKKTLVVIAGMSLCGLEGQGSAVEAFYTSFSEEYTVYLFDRRKKIPQGLTLTDMSEDVYFCLQQFSVESAVFYGVSQGGMIAMTLAVNHPETVQKLMLCSTASRENPLFCSTLSAWRVWAETKNVVGLNRSFFKLVYSEKMLESVRETLPVLEQQGTAADCERFLCLIDAMSGLNLYDRLEEIRCPVLVIGDENDRVLGVEASKEIAEKLQCERILYREYSHAVYDEAPDIKVRLKEFADR